MLKITSILFCLLGLLCTYCHAEEMTVEKLLELQNRAIDQNGLYRKAKSSMTRQKLTMQGERSISGNVIQYFLMPDKSKSLVFLNGKLNYTRIFNGKKGWAITADGKQIKELSGNELELQKILTAMNNPNKNLLKIFKSIQLSEAKLGDETYYKLTCIPKPKELDPVIMYVDMEDYLPKRMDLYVWSGGKKYKSITLNKKYAVVNSVRLVEISEVEVMGTKQFFVLEDFQLGLPLSDSDFEPSSPFDFKK